MTYRNVQDFAPALEMAGDKMELYCVTFEKADVIVGFGQTLVAEL